MFSMQWVPILIIIWSSDGIWSDTPSGRLLIMIIIILQAHIKIIILSWSQCSSYIYHHIWSSVRIWSETQSGRLLMIILSYEHDDHYPTSSYKNHHILSLDHHMIISPYLVWEPEWQALDTAAAYWWTRVVQQEMQQNIKIETCSVKKDTVKQIYTRISENDIK